MFIALSLLLAAVCLLPGVAKVAAHPKMVLSADHFGIPWHAYRLIGVAELAAAVGVVAGLVWLPIGIAAAAGMLVLLVGALATHLGNGDGIHEAAPALVALVIDVAYLAVAVAR